MEINPQTINPEYQISALDPCPGISRPQYYQSVYSCSGFPIEPYQQLYPFQSGTTLILNQTDNYEVEVIAGGDYAYFERVEHTDSAGNFYPYETFGTLLTGLTGAELSGTGSFIGYEGTGTFERENSSVYRVRFDNYSIPEASVTIRIKNLNNNTLTDWHTLIVNPELQFTNQQNADTLLHYYSTDVTPVLRNVNFPCPHPGYGGCPPEDVTFNIEITEGQQYGSIKKELTGEVSTSFTGIPYNELYQFTYYANGVQPDSIATVRILHSSSDAELIPIEYEYTVKRNTVPPPSEGGSIYVKMDKKVVIPGDTINVQLRWIDEVGDTIDFLPMQRFRVDLAEGSEYGTILDILTADTSDTFTEITNEFKVIVNPQIEQQQAKIILVAEADLMIFTRPVRINNGTKTAKQIQESKVDKNDEQGGSNTDFIIIGNHLVGVGEITITKTPFVVEIIPPIASAGDTAQIIPMKLNPDGTTTPFDSLQTFELGMLDGCMLGKLSNAGIDTNYFYGVAQPFYFIADSSADSGSVNIRVGVIEMNQQNKSLTSNSQLQPDNPVTYCFLNTYQTELFVDEILVVGNECGAGAPTCNGISQAPLGFKEEVVEWTGNYIFNKEGYYPETLEISSGGMTYFLRDGEFKLIPITAPRKDKIYAIPLSGSFYGHYEIETCFNKNINNGKGAYQYSFKSIGETDNYIHKPIIIQIADYSNDPYEMKSENDLTTISFERTCEAIIDFEYQRYRSSVYVDNFFDLNNVLFGIVDVYWEHEKYHKRDAMRFINNNYDKKKLKITKSDGISVSKTLKEHFNTTFACDEYIKTYNEAKIKGEEYIESAMKEYQKFFEEKWLLGDVYIYEFKKWYNETELFTHWSNSVQNKISSYQTLLIARPGYNPTQCEIELKEIKKLWEPFKKYKNSL